MDISVQNVNAMYSGNNDDDAEWPAVGRWVVLS